MTLQLNSLNILKVRNLTSVLHMLKLLPHDLAAITAVHYSVLASAVSIVSSMSKVMMVHKGIDA